MRRWPRAPHLINDCSGLSDERLAGVVARYDAGLVVMHLKGELNVRARASTATTTRWREIAAFLRERLERALAAGVAARCAWRRSRPRVRQGAADRISRSSNASANCVRWAIPILFAASRKSFIGRTLQPPGEANCSCRRSRPRRSASPRARAWSACTTSPKRCAGAHDGRRRAITAAARRSRRRCRATPRPPRSAASGTFGGRPPVYRRDATVYLGLGSNLGDRQGNILQALQKLRARCDGPRPSRRITRRRRWAASSGPAFLNVAAEAGDGPRAARARAQLRAVEVAIGRQRTQLLTAARPIDIDILLVDGLIARFRPFRGAAPVPRDRVRST